MEKVLQVEGLKKTFGEREVVAGISLEVQAGEIFGLLGPNGAGKSTSLSCIAGLLQPDAGRILIDGLDVAKAPFAARARLGLVPQDLALYDDFSVENNLRSFGRMLPGLNGTRLERRVAWCLEFAQLVDSKKRKVAKLSGGMKRRLNLAVALLAEPKVVLADEPTVGVDPQSRNLLFESMEALAAQGMAVVYTTHYMEEVERLCQGVAIVDQGRIIAAGSLEELIASDHLACQLRLEWQRPLPEDLREAFYDRFTPLCHGVEGSRMQLGFDGPAPLAEVVCWLNKKAHPPAAIHMERHSLEDLFLRLTGRSMRDG